MEIGGLSINPGINTNIKIPIGDMPSNNPLYIELKVFRAETDGPCVVLLAGIHGDEVNGVEILRQLLAKKYLLNLRLGTVIVIPIVNVYGFIHRSRALPDGKDLNRCFPGNGAGSLAARIARAITKNILSVADVLIDFHTGGHHHYNYPQIRYTRDHEESLLIGKAFHPPFLIAKAPIPKSLRKIAVDMGKSTLVFEGGENNRLDHFSIKEGLRGTLRVLSFLNMLQSNQTIAHSIYQFEKTSWMRSAHAGIFTPHFKAGEAIQKGTLLGEIGDPLGNNNFEVIASRDGILIAHNNAPLVNQGDALFHTAY